MNKELIELPIFRDSEYTKQDILESERNLLGFFKTLKNIQDRINNEKQSDRLNSTKNTSLKTPNKPTSDKEET